MHQMPRLHHVRIVRSLSLATRNPRSQQINSDLTKANPYTADQVFDEHWQTWFTEDDAWRLKGLGMNTVRIPVRFLLLGESRTPFLTICAKAWLLAR